nr:hypothetical protein [Tanacetum cinerariifolium]
QDGISQQEEIDIVTETEDVLPPSVENDDDDYDLLLGEADLFLFDNSIPLGIENVADDPEGDVYFLEESLINDSILSHESSDFNFEDSLLIPRPPPEPPDDNFNLEPEAPPSPDYIPGPEEPEQVPPTPDYVPGLEHADDEIVAEDQPYVEDASPTTQSPEYVPESDLEAHPEDDDNEDLEEDPTDEEEEEEEHPAPADSVVVASTAADQAPSAEETEPFKTDESVTTPPPHLAYRMTARISIPAPVPMPAWSDLEVVRLLAMSSPPASPLSPWSSPPPQIPFPPLPPILSPPSPVEDRPKVTLPPRKRLDIALGPKYEVEESSSAAAARPAGGFRADYGFVATVDREIMRDPEREVGYGITDSWDEIVETLQGAPVSTGHAHAYTRQLMETEARMSREAWVRATDVSERVHGEVISLRTTVLGQISEIRELQAADRRRQTVISELLGIDHRSSTEISELRAALQGQVTALRDR